MISAFMVLTLLILSSGCDNEGIVGEGLNPAGERVQTSTYDISTIDIIKDNGFSGRLGNTAMGIVNDPDYGTITSSALLKPSITRNELEVIPEEFSLNLQMELNSLKYGVENSNSQYNIYEIDGHWRGREITYNNPISFDESNLLGSFQVTDESSIEVELDQEWANRYRMYYNEIAANRDSIYRSEFKGIAVVPAEQNQKIDYLKHQTSNDTTEAGVTRFLIKNDQDSLLATMPLIEFGTSMERSNIPDIDEGIVLHNTLESIMKIDFDDIGTGEFEGKEIINAQLVLTVDPTPDNTLPGGFNRPQIDLLRAHFFGSEPVSIASDIFARSAAFGNNISDEQQFNMNVTEYLIDKLYGQVNTTPLYLSIQSINGLIYSTTFYGQNAPENLRPRLIVTTINPEN